MRITSISILLTLLLCIPIYSQEPLVTPTLKVEGKTKLIVEAVPFQIISPDNATLYSWRYPDGVKANKSPKGNVLTVTTCPRGVLSFNCELTTIDFDKKSVSQSTLTIEIIFGDIAPLPPPTPDPPTPTPTPKGELTVLIVFESASLPTMPASQRDGILRSTKFQSLLTDRTDKKGPNNRGWNIWDKDQMGVDKMDIFWQDAFKRPRSSIPYIHLFKGGKVAYEGELPKTAEEATNLINKYAGG